MLRRLSELARFKHARPELRLGLLGCMAQHNRAALVEKAPWLDLIAGPDSYRRLPELLGRARFDRGRAGGQSRRAPGPLRDLCRYRARARARRARVRHRDAWVRPLLRVLRGAVCARTRAQRAARGDSGRHPRDSLRAAHGKSCCSGRQSTLIASASRLRPPAAPGRGGRRLERIRFTSPHPADMTRLGHRSDGDRAQGAALAASAGAVGIGPDTGRDGTRVHGRRVSEFGRTGARGDSGELRSRPTSSSASTARKRADFRATLELMAAVRYDSAFSFKYSLRENTRAFRLGDTVGEAGEGPAAGRGDRATGTRLGRAQSRARRRALRSAGRGSGAPRRRDALPGKRRSSRPRYSRPPIR